MSLQNLASYVTVYCYTITFEIGNEYDIFEQQ